MCRVTHEEQAIPKVSACLWWSWKVFMSSTPHYDGMIEHKNLLGYFNFLLSLVENHEGKKKKNEVGISKSEMPTQSLVNETLTSWNDKIMLYSATSKYIQKHLTWFYDESNKSSKHMLIENALCKEQMNMGVTLQTSISYLK